MTFKVGDFVKRIYMDFDNFKVGDVATVVQLDDEDNIFVTNAKIRDHGDCSKLVSGAIGVCPYYLVLITPLEAEML